MKIYIFDMPYHCKFLSDFQKLGTVVIRETRSLIWVSIIMILKISLKNNLEFTFFWNNVCVHPLEMLRFSRNRTRMLIDSWWSIISSAPLDLTRKLADINCLIREMNFHFQLCVCHTLIVMYQLISLMGQFYLKSSENSKVYTASRWSYSKTGCIV